jgi:hypothetical protein
MPKTQQRLFNAMSATAAIVAGIAARNLVKAAWQKKFDEEPPQNPADRATAWREALMWSAATGAVIGVTRMLARRGTAAGWERVTGHEAPL